MKKLTFLRSVLAVAMSVGVSSAFANAEGEAAGGGVNDTFATASFADPAGATGSVGNFVDIPTFNDRDFWAFESTGGTLGVTVADGNGNIASPNFNGFKPAVVVFDSAFIPIGGYESPASPNGGSISFNVPSLTAGETYYVMLTAFQNEGLISGFQLSSSFVWGFSAWDETGATAGSGSEGFSNSSYDYNLTLTNAAQIAAVPVPAAAWLMGSGLIGLAGIARRKSA